jgi:hypothetical protein
MIDTGHQMQTSKVSNQLYWERMGKSFPDVTSHARRWAGIESGWKRIQSGGEVGLSALHAWEVIQCTIAVHANHEVYARCAGCGAGYCEHLAGEMLCFSLPICQHCDTWVSPNPYNPACAWLVNHFGVKLAPEPASKASDDSAAARRSYKATLEEIQNKGKLASSNTEPSSMEGQVIAPPRRRITATLAMSREGTIALLRRIDTTSSSDFSDFSEGAILAHPRKAILPEDLTSSEEDLIGDSDDSDTEPPDYEGGPIVLRDDTKDPRSTALAQAHFPAAWGWDK